MDRVPKPHIRHARADDLEGLWQLEQAAFEPARRVTRASLARSLRSPHQVVLVVDGPGRLDAMLVLWMRHRTWRVYDVAVAPARQGQGLGRALLAEAERMAVRAGAKRLVLEAAAQDERLRRIYERAGFRLHQHLSSFYGAGRHASRFVKNLQSPPPPRRGRRTS